MDLSQKIALCFSGQIRTGATNVAQILESLGGLKSKCDFFMHSWDINTPSLWDGREVPETEDERNKIRNMFSKVDSVDITSVTKELKPVAVKIDSYEKYKALQEDEFISRKFKCNFHPMFASIWECNNLKRLHERKNYSVYGRVIRIRYDMIFAMDLSDEIAYTFNRPNTLHFIDPHNKFPDWIEDICWISNSKTMDKVCEFNTEREKYYSNKDQQELIREYLEIQKIDFRPFKNNSMALMRGDIYSQDMGGTWKPQ